jgi:hypothetical protein
LTTRSAFATAGYNRSKLARSSTARPVGLCGLLEHDHARVATGVDERIEV